MDLIKLDRPLPWISHSGKSGWVLALGKGSLLLQSAAADHAKEWPSSITVRLDSRQSFDFSGRWQPPLEPDTALFELLEGSDALEQLLGQLRKGQHIEICRDSDVEASDRFTGFSEVELLPEALPLLDPSQIDTSTSFLGRTFQLPLLITGMTGGIEEGQEINRRLAQAAAAYGIPMGVGSQRIALDKPEYAAIFKVKDSSPGLFLIGNIGMAQLTDSQALLRCQRAIDMIEADALAIHLNLVQESVQVEGDRHFTGFMQNLEQLCRRLPVPIMIKEVGSGISPSSAKRLVECGVAAIDVGGRGGTSWAHIEGLRSRSSLVQDLGRVFRDWGIPTAYSLLALRRSLPDLPLVATGGIRDGLSVAKAVALGAQCAGVGLPLLRAALESEEAPFAVLAGFKRALEIAMLASGAERLSALRERVVFGRPLEAEFRQAFLGSSASFPTF